MNARRNYHLFFALTLLLTGCAGRAPRSAPGEKPEALKFIFITTCVEEDFFKPVIKGMTDAACLLGVDCTFTGTHGVDIPAQAEMVRQAVRDGVDGIALCIIDPVAFDPVVQEARDAGVPVVAFAVDDHATENARLSAINQRLYEAGRTLGQRAARFVPDDSVILMTMHAAGVSALEDRLRGVQDGLREAGRKNVTWKVAITGNTGAESAAVIAAELKANPQIKVVLCTGQADTEGAGLAISEHYAGQGYIAAGFDLSEKILKFIEQGQIAFTIDQQPYIQGFFPVVQLTFYQRYGIMPRSMDAGATIITADEAPKVLDLKRQHYR